MVWRQIPTNAEGDSMNWNAPRWLLDEPERYWRKLWSWRPLYWLRCHTFTRYHVIDISGQDGYRWGWIDRDHAMFLACFKLLVEYVELERPFDVIDWDSDPDHQHAAREIRELYDWWKAGRAEEHRRVDEFFDEHRRDDGSVMGGWDSKENGEHWHRMYTALDTKDDEQLLRLMKIRRSLWT
jgi:hypothetical protein